MERLPGVESRSFKHLHSRHHVSINCEIAIPRIAQLWSEGTRSPGLGAALQQAENRLSRESGMDGFRICNTDALLATSKNDLREKNKMNT